MTARRTQEQRRAETIGKLLNATIHCLAELGYARTSTHQICRRAGVSQGAMFNHFSSRLEVVVATTELICERHIGRMTRPLDGIGEDQVSVMIQIIRQASRTHEHAAWHEVMVAARTDDALRPLVRGILARFERAVLAMTQNVLSLDAAGAARIGVVVLSLMHMFDSEAVTVKVHPNPEIEALRARWATSLLRNELESICQDLV